MRLARIALLLALAWPALARAGDEPKAFEFAHEIPEEIVFRGYSFIREVEFANEQRFLDEKGFATANEAWAKTKQHAAKLLADRVYRALDTARQEVDVDEFLSGYVYEAIFASPYLICYTNGERVDAKAVAKLPLAARKKVWEATERRKATWRMALAEGAKVFQQTYAEFLRRYGEACDLKDLMAAWGGRPDYPSGKRSYRDGCPMVVWIFADKKAFTDHHEKVKQEGINPGIAGYVGRRDGRIIIYDEANEDREFEVSKCVREGTVQLLHWFRRQKDEWGSAPIPADFFEVGLPEYIGAVSLAKDRSLTFQGLNRPQIEKLKLVKDKLAKENKKMYAFPLKELVTFETTGSVVAWAAEHWGPFGVEAGLPLYHLQAWALIHFLNEIESHKYQPRFTLLLNDMLNFPPGAEHYAIAKFKQRMGIAAEDDWKALDREFKDHYLQTLATMRLETLGPKPPDRDDWPGYVEPDLLDPKGPP